MKVHDAQAALGAPHPNVYVHESSKKLVDCGATRGICQSPSIKLNRDGTATN